MQLVKPAAHHHEDGQAVGLVSCPNCEVAMVCISLKALEDNNDLHEAVYRCPRCRTETKRWKSA